MLSKRVKQSIEHGGDLLFLQTEEEEKKDNYGLIKKEKQKIKFLQFHRHT